MHCWQTWTCILSSQGGKVSHSSHQVEGELSQASDRTGKVPQTMLHPPRTENLQIVQLYRRAFKLHSSAAGRLQSLDWTSGMDWWTGLVDWTGGLTLNLWFLTRLTCL